MPKPFLAPPTVERELKIIGAGFGRTGTSSLKSALNILGYGPCHHMSYLAGLGKMERCSQFIRAYQGEPTDWRALMRNFHSTLDEPTSDFVPELTAAYPDAKVILTVRDSPQVWYTSFLTTLAPIDSLITGLLVASIPPLFVFWSLGRNVRSFRRKTYGSVGTEAYEAHIARMKELVPADKLLVFNVKQGWAPLCQFLGANEPSIPFPRVNDAQEMRNALWGARVAGTLAWMVEIGLVALVVGLTFEESWAEGIEVSRLWKPFFKGEL